MPQEQDKLFEMDPNPEPVPERPELDMDKFHPGRVVPPQSEPPPFKQPARLRGVPTETEQAEIEHLGDRGFGTIQARQKVLKGNFVDPGLPPDTDTPEKARGTKSGSRSPAQNPGVRGSPAYDKVPHRDDPSELPTLTDEEKAEHSRRARDYARKLAEGQDG